MWTTIQVVVILHRAQHSAMQGQVWPWIQQGQHTTWCWCTKCGQANLWSNKKVVQKTISQAIVAWAMFWGEETLLHQQEQTAERMEQNWKKVRVRSFFAAKFHWRNFHFSLWWQQTGHCWPILYQFCLSLGWFFSFFIREEQNGIVGTALITHISPWLNEHLLDEGQTWTN